MNELIPFDQILDTPEKRKSIIGKQAILKNPHYDCMWPVEIIASEKDYATVRYADGYNTSTCVYKYLYGLGNIKIEMLK